jgi:hypothetical protein
MIYVRADVRCGEVARTLQKVQSYFSPYPSKSQSFGGLFSGVFRRFSELFQVWILTSWPGVVCRVCGERQWSM